MANQILKLNILEAEVRIAQLADKYTTSDGYILTNMILSVMGDAYVTPHMGHSHWIGKDSLSDKEKAAAQSYTKEKVSYLRLQMQTLKQIQLEIVQRLFTIV